MESVLKDVGTCGRFQFFHVFCIQCIRFISASSMYMMVYGLYEPQWHCADDGPFPNTSSYNTTNCNYNSSVDGNSIQLLSNRSYMETISIDTNSSFYIMCQLNSSNKNVFNSSIPGRCDQLALCNNIIFDPTSVTLVSEFGLICDQAYIPSLMIAVQMVGATVGSIVAGQAGEVFGRKKSFYSTLAVASGAIFIAAWSTSWQMYTGFMFFIGLGGSGIITSYGAYCMEFLTPKWRGRVSATPTWNIWLLLFALLIMGFKNWRYIHMTCGCFGGLFLLFALWTPESLRWLHVHGKHAEAEKVLEKIIKYNTSNGEVDIKMALENLNQDATDERARRKYTYLDLVRTSEIRSLTIKTSFIAVLFNICYFTLGLGISSFSGDYYTNLIISFASEIPFVLMLGIFVNSFGRRLSLSLFMVMATLLLVACVITHYTVNEEVAGTIIKYLALMAKGCCILLGIVMVLFTLELYPTEVRSLAMGFNLTVSRAGNLVSVSLIPRDQSSAIITFIVLSGALIIGVFVNMSFSETKNRPLDDRIEETRSKASA